MYTIRTTLHDMMCNSNHAVHWPIREIEEFNFQEKRIKLSIEKIETEVEMQGQN